MIEAYQKFKFLLTKNQIFGIKVLFVLLIFGMCFESGLLYLLIPVIKLITDEEYYIGFKERYFSEIEIINSLDYSQFIFFAITMIVLAFLAKKYFFNDFDISTKSIHR